MRAPALYALLFFICGILVAGYLALPSLLLLGVTILSLASAIVCSLIGRLSLSRVAICLALTSAGAFATELVTSELPVNHISHFTDFDEPVELVGEVVSEPDMRADKTFLAVAVDSLAKGDRRLAVTGRIRLRLAEPTMRFNYRDRIRFRGYLNAPLGARNPGAFDYRRYLLIRGINGVVNLPNSGRVELVASGAQDPFIRNLVKPIRDYIIATFDSFLPPASAAVMRGFLIGDVRFISRDVYQRFKDTGTLHVLAASGANVAYVIATIFFIMRPFRTPRRFKLIVALVGVVIFSFLAYNQPSVVRASVMAVTALLGKLLYRDVEPLNVISFAALVILAFEPLYLFDLGFQLSFAAAYGLVLVMPELDKRLPRAKHLPGKLLRNGVILFAGTVTAQLAVSPILLAAFHQVPLVSFVSNLIVVPLVGIATTAGVLLVLFSAIPYLNELIAAVLTLTLKTTLASIDYFTLLPVAKLRLGTPSAGEIMLYYALLLALISWWKRSRLTVLFSGLGFVAVNIIIWGAVLGSDDQISRMTILDTGDVSTIFVEQPGTTTLINGGGASGGFDRGESVVAPFLLSQGILDIDRILATSDRAGNLQSLQSVLAGLREPWESDPVTDSARIESAPSQLLLQFDSLQILSLCEYQPVQNLRNLPQNVDLLICDWRYLQHGQMDVLAARISAPRIILTSYPSRYESRDLLEQYRTDHPGQELLSTLESGGIVLKIDQAANRLELALSD